MPRPLSKLDSLTKPEREQLVKRLYTRQGGKCYICGRSMALAVDRLDVDHISGES